MIRGSTFLPHNGLYKTRKAKYNKGCYCKIFKQRKLQCFNHQKIVATTSTLAVPFCIILQVPSYLQPLSPQDLGRFWGTGCVFGSGWKKMMIGKGSEWFWVQLAIGKTVRKLNQCQIQAATHPLYHSNLLQHSLKHPIHRVYINNMYVNGYSSG